MQITFIVNILVSVIVGSVAIRVCPPSELIVPCICNDGVTQELACRGSTDLDKVFDQLSTNVAAKDQHFHSFYLNSRTVTKLEANAFKGIKFEKIYLGGSKLTYIHNDAFSGTQYDVKELYAFATNLSLGYDNEYQLFAAISSLQNLQRLVISGSNIVAIPSWAFGDKYSNINIQRKLTEIELGLAATPTISSIGFEAFANLPALQYVSFSGQRIDYIQFKAFAFYEESNKTLTIDLTGNNLNDSSFEVGSFLGAKRPVKIHFGLTGCNDNLTFLRKEVFEPFLNENKLNTIDMGRKCRNYICDCRMDWIVYGNYDERIENLKCSDGNTIKLSQDRRKSHVTNCSDSKEILGERFAKELEEVLIDVFRIEDNDNEVIENEVKDELCSNNECFDASSEMLIYLNKSIDPCDDFYGYTCGLWEDIHLLPILNQLLSLGGVEYDNFVKLRHQVDLNLDDVLSTAIKVDDPIVVQDAMRMYQSCKNNIHADHNAMKNIIKQLGGWPIVDGFLSDQYKWQNALVMILANVRSDVIITFESFVNIESVRQLRIGHSSFVVSSSTLVDINTSLRDFTSYVLYIYNTALLFGAPENNSTNNETLEAVKDIIRFESELAEISENSDSKEFLIERNLESLKCIIPEFDWIGLVANLLREHNIDIEHINKTNVIYDLHYLIRVSQLLQKTDSKIIANYLVWRVVETFGFLAAGPEFLEYQQSFHNQQSNEKTKILWKQCLSSLKTHLPLALTRKYAEHYLPLRLKPNVVKIVSSVKQAFIELLEEKDWLEDKLEFINKINDMQENVAYPDWIFDDNLFYLYHKNLTDNLKHKYNLTDSYSKISKYWSKQFFQSIGEKVNKLRDWDQTPLFVGAYYDIVDNIINLPLGLLHPPFYSGHRPQYINFGTIGAVIGHEISHGSMPRYNNNETLIKPWNSDSLKIFLSRAKCFVERYSDYYDDLANMNLNGLKTFEEDMSDVAGIKASFIAYNNYKTLNNNSDIQLMAMSSKYSVEQLFFIAHAQKWCRYLTAGQIKIKIQRGSHSPEKYRVNGALSNFDEFAKAFNCEEGSKMNPEVQCELW